MILTMTSFIVKAQIPIFHEGFEAGNLPAGWTVLDADNDGKSWMHSSVYGDLISGHTGEGAFVSYSYDTWNEEVLFPDNWLITPAISLTGSSTLTFWRMVGYGYPADHYGVYVFTASANDTSAFNLLFEETPSAQNDEWTMRTVNLENYTDSTIYIAFRHFNCTDQLHIALDDITVMSFTTAPTIIAQPILLQFNDVQVGSPSEAKLLQVNTYNITGGITANVAEPFEISIDGINFGQTATMSDSDTVLYIRYYPLYVGVNSTFLTLTDGTATTEVYLFGKSIDCNSFTLPYSQDFNSLPDNTIPDCWSQINPSNGYPKTTDAYTSPGDNVLAFKCGNNGTQSIYAVLPQMPEDLSKLQIQFNTFRESNNSGTFSVGYVTDPTDSGTFVPVWSINAAQIGDNVPHSYTVSFENVDNDSAATRHITFKYASTNSLCWFVDDIIVEEIPTCVLPTDLVVRQVTSSSATVSWEGIAESYNLYYKTSDDTGWIVIQGVTIDENGYTLEGLTPATSYYWYVESVCEDDSTIQSMTNSFTTDCAVFIAPFNQNFDASATLPICWGTYTGLAENIFAGAELSPATSNNWVFNNSNVFGLRHAKLNIYGASCNKWLVTPAIDLTALTDPALTFDLALTGYNNANPISNLNGQPDDKFMVFVSTDNGATWSADNATVWSNDGTGDHVFNLIPAAGQEITIPLSNYAGQTIVIAFYGESTVSNGDNDLHIDNITVSNISNCPKPANLTLLSVASNSVTIDWDESGSASTWNIEYGPSGFQHGADNATTATVTVHPFTIDNLTTMSYDFYIQSDCGSEQSIWAGPISATPGTYNMGTTASDTLTTCSLIIYDNGGANNDYSANCNFTLVLYPEIEGNSVAVSGTYMTENNRDYLRIYDGIGTNGTLLGEYSGNGIVSSIIASAGPLTIKFSSDGGVQKSGFELMVSCTSCTSPENLTVSNVSAESADLSWTGSASAYLVEYKAENDTAWITYTSSDTYFSLSNLAPGTFYTAKVYSYCDGEHSLSASISFTTTMEAVSIPYSTDFSEGNEQSWQFNNGSCSNFWKIGPVSDSTAALYITSDGNMPEYNTNSFSVVSAEKLFTIGDAADLLINFDVKVGGESTYDYLKVFFAPIDSLYPAANTNKYYSTNTYSDFAFDFSDYLQDTESSSYPYKFNLTGGNTVHVSAILSNPNIDPTANSKAKLVFLWKNDNSEGFQPAAIIYNVSIEEFSCPAPTNLVVSNITTGSADISWAPSDEESDWILEYKEDTDSVWTSITFSGAAAYTLDSLTAGTTYQVRVQANCGGGHLSSFTSSSFMTNNIIIVLPSVITDITSSVTETSAVLNGVISELGNVPITSRGFEWRHASESTSSTVYAMDGYPLFSCFVSNLAPNTAYIYKAFITTSDTILYGQEMTFTTLPEDTPEPCESPTNLRETGVIMDKSIGYLFVVWDDHANASQWNLQYKLSSENNWTNVVVTGNPTYTFENLEAYSEYNLRVQAICDENNLSEWSNVLTATAQGVGINDYLINSITLYPNPTNDIVNVECTMNNVQLEGIEVIDVYGKVVRTVVWANNYSPICINVSGLANGIYFVRVTTDEGTVTKTFIKQ